MKMKVILPKIRRSKDGIEERVKWMAFKNYLFISKDLNEVAISSAISADKYLIYATVFKIDYDITPTISMFVN